MFNWVLHTSLINLSYDWLNKTAYCSLAMLIDYNHEHNILRIFNTLPNETK